MRLKMLLDTVKEWWKPVNGTVSMWDLTMAKVQDKLLTGLTSILYRVEKVTLKIRSEALETQSRARAIIGLRRIQQIKPIQWHNPNVALGYNALFHSHSTGHYNTAIGYAAGTGLGIGTYAYVPNNSIQFNSNTGKCVLTITADGDVEWTGKPSEAADILVQSFQFAVENKKGVTKAARRRYYLKACQNILNKAEKMDHSEFVDFLRKQVYNKERKVIMDALKGENV